MIDRANVAHLVQKYGVDEEIARKAFEKIDNFEVFAVAFSGKIGSGKDSVGLLFAESLLAFDDEQLKHTYFAVPLKAEMTKVIELIVAASDEEAAVDSISREMNVDTADSRYIVEHMFEEAKAGVIKTGYDRTAKSRLAIQYWGTEIRRKQDDLYWVKPFVHNLLHELANGVNVVLTDTRFPNEAIASLEAGAKLIRLDVSDEEQFNRVMARDGVSMSEAARNHVSETMLDDFEHFTMRIDTGNYTSAEDVVYGIYEIMAEVAKEAIEDEAFSESK